MDQQDPTEWHSRTLRSWHLAILRFALTRDNADRLGVLAIANAIDRLGSPQDDRSDFDFRRTYTELCEAIQDSNEVGAETLLHQYLARVDDSLLKRALTAVLKIGQPERISTKRSRAYSAPWRTRGLPSRRSA
ncbi:hypothetical protein [Bradyrhizobium sp. ARR65]|uniref:hypothetical protein n=1 Tax=Bradyrhizobium sp. ARR65 TaxID=1040989 RepID=UPI000A3EB7D8|nr:hypothetical protein [Bradyrhizobium sp. ARR65]